MNINLERHDDKIVLQVNLKFRGKRGETKVFTTADAKKWITENHPDINLNYLLSAPNKYLHNGSRLSGEWIYSIKKQIPIDILKDNVKIDEIKIEAESPAKEQKKEASLPNGLKKMPKVKPKPKRKRAPRKKKTEE